ncbi:MAG: glycoside hydrolase family 32 protein [Roseburia sp.]|nr:glycoside hydrolase family 32 protein [Roseburia sp.]
MEITITKKYLIFPVNTTAKNKLLSFSAGEKSVYEFNIKLDHFAPDFYAYIDVSRFQGLTLNLSVKPEMKISYEESDYMEIPDLYQEPLRPQVHFSTKNGWINDPNGLLYLDGVYHMFYQHNPAGNHWDNMHWGHAVSSDLIHWEEKDIALFLGENGNIFSGSAILDKNNLLGLANENGPAALLYYTATTHPFTQRMAYSTDHFKTIEEYEGNPVIPHLAGANRDPKVVYCEERNTYIMALYFIEDEYGLLSSANLTDWHLFQKIRFPGEAECPDIIPMKDSDGRKKWVFMGANDKYIVGEFLDGKFTATQDAMCLHYGTSAYAGQTFSNLPDGRVVRVVWDRWNCQASRFNGQMGIPMELTLKESNGTYYLCANPVKEIESIYSSQVTLDNRKVSADMEQCIALEDKPYLLKMKGVYAKNVILNFQIFGCDFSVDFTKNQLMLGDKQMPVSISQNNFDLTLLIDRCSMEIFADGGKAYIASVEEYTVCDRNLPWLKISSNVEYCFENITLYSLDSIWGEKATG